jgi:hypothetical protein
MEGKKRKRIQLNFDGTSDHSILPQKPRLTVKNMPHASHGSIPTIMPHTVEEAPTCPPVFDTIWYSMCGNTELAGYNYSGFQSNPVISHTSDMVENSEQMKQDGTVNIDNRYGRLESHVNIYP